ncbi:FAD:protein FMN transferase [Pilimelia terevasa]|uniref:FAD:protein FMN transferase n=1 Tax=Pilimelia terevasa TaxID=53372 RepID=A0A8J3BUR9_9ACTN|nr:FAD:protein FMN transferase [Pilimelia terevasa]GGK38994.1 FAD:protein FMN transferase [Pilimelia terevasa]
MRHVEHVMGTAVSIELADPLPAATKVGMIDQTVAWLHEVDRRFSTYKPHSEIRRLGRGDLTVAECSSDVREVLATCAELWRETDGFFDAYATGQLDPSGFVKGWSVEVASRWLAANGSSHHCLNAGGDIRARGCPSPGRQWRIGVRHPWQPDKLSWVVTGNDVAVATSGIYERGEHVIDPVRGRPATQLQSVTVVGPDLGRADAYATTAMAMGRTGLAWLARLDQAGYASAAVTADGRAYTSRSLPATALAA